MAIDRFDKTTFEAALPVVREGHENAGQRLWEELGLEENEYTYWVKVTDTAFIKIRSSVRPNGVAAETGKDSIRIWLVDPDGKPLGNKIKSHISRVNGWEKRMTDALRELWKRHVAAGNCPRCGRAMGVWKVKKDGKNKGRLFAKCRDHGHFFWLDQGRPAPKPKPERKAMAAMDEQAVRGDLEAFGLVKEKLNFLREKIGRDPEYTLFALTFVYDRQTADEKSAEVTCYHNTVGFSGVDAEILSSFAKQYIARGTLSEKQMKIASTKMPRYAKQILDILRDKR
jgi:hypothetical protein